MQICFEKMFWANFRSPVAEIISYVIPLNNFFLINRLWWIFVWKNDVEMALPITHCIRSKLIFQEVSGIQRVSFILSLCYNNSKNWYNISCGRVSRIIQPTWCACLHPVSTLYLRKNTSKVKVSCAKQLHPWLVHCKY